MKKVGIITWYWGNYGSILQAYALSQAVLLTGNKCEIVCHHVNGDFATQMRYRVSHKGVIKTIGYYMGKIYGKVKNSTQKSETDQREETFNRFIRAHLTLSDNKYGNSDYENCTQYDAYICGSDQIWNPNFTFLSPFYWLGFVPKGKIKIAYAPSMGSADLSEKDKGIIAQYLSDYKAISVREEKSADILNGILGDNKVSAVLDPTMLIDSDTWKKCIGKNDVKERYLFAYIIRGSKEQREYIEKIARQHRLKIVTYPFLEGNAIEEDEKNWGDIRCFEDDPFDFLGKIYYAEMIITDSFHCSVFSTLFHKDFYVLRKTNDTTHQFGRLEQLLGMCNECGRIIDTQKNLVRIENDDFSESDEAIRKMQNKSLEYLENALSDL